MRGISGITLKEVSPLAFNADFTMQVVLTETSDNLLRFLFSNQLRRKTFSPRRHLNLEVIVQHLEVLLSLNIYRCSLDAEIAKFVSIYH